MSYPNNWEVNAKHLVEQSDRDGRDAIYSALKELIKFGYIKKINHRKDGGKFKDVSYDVFELPNTEKPNTEKPNTENPEMAQPITELPNTEKPDTEKPNTENPYAYKGLNSTKDLIDQGLTLTKAKGECDASLQPAQPATQPEEIDSPVQTKVQDPDPKGSASLGSGQAETVGQFQEKQSSAASLLENLKIQLNQLRDDYIPPAWRYEWRMAKALPWRDPRTGDIPESFSVFVGKKLMFKGDRESMTALEKGRNYVRNAEPKVAGMQGLIDYWEDYQRKLSPVKVVPINQKQEPPKSSPPPENWVKNALGARYRNAS
ncbi:hypothetical protein [Adonisia turfae]|uniref:hypothetical protein n=1 Tax=Adonisia turfae TaxID=2950184 RepID=UPI0013D89571|nr:hypothetical protein [Adonisia turfae]